MIINEPGTYTLVYTATDECGNEARDYRTVIVKELGHFEGTDDISIGECVPIDLSSGVTAYDGDGNIIPFTVSPNTIDTCSVGEHTITYSTDAFSTVRTITVEPVRTVLYTDGTFIINELDSDKSENIVAHGAEMSVYSPFDTSHPYTFGASSDREWNASSSSVISVQIGSRISPTSTRTWFYNFSRCTNVNLSKLDTGSVTSMSEMFRNCSSLTSLDLSSFNTGSVTSMIHMFYGCSSLQTIIVSVNFVVAQVTSSSNMFANMSTNLVGGAGTVWSSSAPTDKTRAKIDGGTSDPGYFTAA